MPKAISIVEETRPLLDPDAIISEATNEILENALVDESTEDGEGLRHLLEQRTLHKTLLWHQKPNVYILYFAVLIYFLSTAVSISSQVVLLLDVICRNAGLGVQISTCDDPKVQEMASQLQSALIFTTGLVCSLVSGKVGELSDRYGRRPTLLLIAVVRVISTVFNIFLLMPSTPYHKSWFIIVNAFENSIGGVIGVLSVSNSFITDVADPEERVMLLGFSNGALYAGFGFGPLIGSLILRYTKNVFSTLYTSLILSVAFLVIVFFFIHESRPKMLRRMSQSLHLKRKASFASTRSNFKDTSLAHFLNLFSPLKTLWVPKHQTLGYIPRINIILLISVEAIVLVSTSSLGPVLVLYLRYAFHTSPEFLGYYVSSAGLSKTVVLYLISPFLLYLLRKHLTARNKSMDRVDWTLIFIGSIFEAFSPLIILLARNQYEILLSSAFGALGALAVPAVQGSVTKYVPQTKIGEVYGGIALIKNLLIMIFPPLFLNVYASTVKYSPKFVFYLYLGVAMFGTVFALLLRVHQDPEDVESDLESSRRSSFVERYGVTETENRVR